LGERASRNHQAERGSNSGSTQAEKILNKIRILT
jgi:hypothetical protein